MKKEYYIKVKQLMQEKNIDLPRPQSRIPLISITVPVWTNLNIERGIVKKWLM